MKNPLIKLFALFLIGCAPIIVSADLYAQSSKNKKKTESVSQKKQAEKIAEAKEAPQETVAAQPEANTAPQAESSPLYQYEAPKEPESSYGWLIVKTLFVLGLMAFGFYYFFKFIIKKTGVNMIGGEAVKVLSVTPVGQNRSLQVIDIAGKIMLLGITESNISVLTEITGKEEIDRVRLASSKSVLLQDKNFQDFLTEHIGNIAGMVKGAGDKLMKAKNSRKSGSSSRFNSQMDEMRSSDNMSAERLEYIMKQKERLRRLNGEDE